MLSPGDGKSHRSSIWAYAPGEFEDIKAVIYDFCESRSGEHNRQFLEDWRGSLVTDDFAGYKGTFLNGVIEVVCMAHARRKFFDLFENNKSPKSYRNSDTPRFLPLNSHNCGVPLDSESPLQQLMWNSWVSLII